MSVSADHALVFMLMCMLQATRDGVEIGAARLDRLDAAQQEDPADVVPTQVRWAYCIWHTSRHKLPQIVDVANETSGLCRGLGTCQQV